MFTAFKIALWQKLLSLEQIELFIKIQTNRVFVSSLIAWISVHGSFYSYRFCLITEKGEIIIFISEDRYLIGIDNKSRKAIEDTPLKIEKLKDYYVLKRLSYQETTRLLPEGNYYYDQFYMIEIHYNCKKFNDWLST